MNAQTRAEIADLLARHGLSPSRRLGQHFLADANITRKIVQISGVGPGSRVVEVGAGTGTLTRALASAGASVVAYEVDGGLVRVLTESTAGLDVELRHADVTDVDFSEALVGGPWQLVANLPYNVGTPVVMDALKSADQVERFIIMVQREVARRFVAQQGSPDYGLPSVVTGIHAESRIEFHVPPQVFYPPPRVESSVVVIERKHRPEGAQRAIELARAGFGQRRKMLRRSLSSVVEDPVALLESAGIDPSRRAEDLSPDDFLRMAAL